MGLPLHLTINDMTIWTLLIGFAIGGGILTGLTWAKQKNHVLAFLQNFTGVWFIFSGLVKAVDPIGTALKMQDYFAEFVKTFEPTSFAFLNPMLKWMAENAIAFSVFTIVLEIVIGIMLILGHRSKLTSWLFLGIMAFFTALTGYTHLTAYVPDGVNFFEFSKWGEYVKTNMRVTDCGCFGDFLKLSPTTSFYKDIALMPVALLFMFRHKDFTNLFTTRYRALMVGAVGLGALAFCFYNTYANEPIFDFRPFKNGVNIREQKKVEEKAAADIKITHYRLAKDGVESLVPYEDYLKDYTAGKYQSADGWKVVEQIKTDPSVERTKISDFLIESLKGEDMSDTILLEKGYTFLVLSGKMKSKVDKKIVQIPDSIFKFDTVRMKIGKVDTFNIVKSFDHLGKREEVFKSYTYDADYRSGFTAMNPILETAEKAGVRIFGVVPYDETKKIEDFRHDAQTAYPFLKGDEKLIKTMMRSNPGLMLLKDGQIVQKWHLKKLPRNFEAIKTEFIK
jgi:uncharacterized membrane protein YphA (DoxX/SURF4 family)